MLPLKKLMYFQEIVIKTFICRRCLNSYTSEKMLKLHKPKYEKIDVTTIKASPE